MQAMAAISAHPPPSSSSYIGNDRPWDSHPSSTFSYTDRAQEPRPLHQMSAGAGTLPPARGYPSGMVGAAPSNDYADPLRARSTSLSVAPRGGGAGGGDIAASSSSSSYPSPATAHAAAPGSSNQRPNSAGPTTMHFAGDPLHMSRVSSAPGSVGPAPAMYDAHSYARGGPAAHHFGAMPSGLDGYTLGGDPNSLVNGKYHIMSPNLPSTGMPPPPHHMSPAGSTTSSPQMAASATMSKAQSYESLYSAANHGYAAPPMMRSGMAGAAPVSTLGKRDRTDSSGSEDEPVAKMPHLQQPAYGSATTQVMNPGDADRMTTVLCLHASVAQKSYGQEKRFLCPPPLVRITGPYRRLPKSHRPILAMSLLSEEGDRQLCQTSHLNGDDDDVVNSYFKTLHISGNTTKAKTISLELSLHPPTGAPSMVPSTTRGPGAPPDLDELGSAFASFQSNPCTIISKPSKKTARARNLQSCIMNGSTICLFNRINSQTVRTKYLCVEEGELAARASQWSAFMIKVVKRAEDDFDNAQGKTLLSSSIPGADRTVTYGSQIVLVDYVTGVHSDTYVVRKVEKCRVQKDATGPVSQMQKLALCKFDEHGTPWYVSAQNGQHGDGTLLNVPPLVKLEDGNAAGFITAGITRAPGEKLLKLTPPKAVLPPDEPGRMTQDEIEDSLSWTVMGVSHFEHSFFDASPGPAQIPRNPITPFPAVVGMPHLDVANSSLSLTVTNFFDTDPHTGAAKPLEIWLGPLGPLQTQILKASGVTLGATPGLVNGYHGALHLQSSQGPKFDSWDAEPVDNTPMYRRETSIRCTVPPVNELLNALTGSSSRSRQGSHSPREPPKGVTVNGSASSGGGNGSNQASPAMNGAFTRSPPQIDGAGGKADQPPNGMLAITFVRPDGISYASPRGIALDRSAGLGWEHGADPAGLGGWPNDGRGGYVPKIM